MSIFLKKQAKRRNATRYIEWGTPYDAQPTTWKCPRGAEYAEWENKAYKFLKPHLRELNVTLGAKVAHGSNIDLYLCDELEEIYGRKNLCLKVFCSSKSVWGFEGASAASTIFDSTVAQNLLAMKGHSTRVYDLVSINGKTAQVTNLLKGQKKPKIVKDPRFEYWFDAWTQSYNHADGKIIDLQGTKLRDPEHYRKYLLKETAKRNEANGHCAGMYQSVGPHSGIRDTKRRLETYKFEDFKGKTVLDIGCSNGMICRAAKDLGAKRVVGIEYPNMAEMAQELAIMDGYFNLDFIGANIKKLSWEKIQKKTKIKRFDIHLFLAMEGHVGWPDWVRNCDTLYFENHGQPRHWEVIDSKKGVIRKGTYND